MKTGWLNVLIIKFIAVTLCFIKYCALIQILLLIAVVYIRIEVHKQHR
jgi:hypothetical protein